MQKLLGQLFEIHDCIESFIKFAGLFLQIYLFI